MRILIFAPNYLPAVRYGGPVRSTHGLARALVEQDHSVTVLTTDVDGPTRLDVPLDRPVELDGVQIHYCPITAPKRFYYSPAIAKLADQLVPQMDAVHVNGMFLWPGPYIARAARRADVPLVISPRGMLMPQMIAGKSKLVKSGWIRLQERSNLAAAQAIHVTSTNEAEGLREMGLGLAPVAVIGNGVDSPAIAPTSEAIDAVWGGIPRGQRVAFLARLDWTKGADMAIEAARAHPTAKILLGGPDQIGLKAQLQPRLTRDDGSSCGAFLGSLDGEAKWAFLAGADVLLAPSVSESFGMSVAEALAVGTPVIATEGVGAAGLLRKLDPALVIPRNQTALCEVLNTLLADDERRVRIGQNAQALAASELSWASIADSITALYGKEKSAP